MAEISVIIPAKNEEDYLPRLLDSLWNQKNVSGLEIIVSIAPTTTDKTACIAEKYSCLIVGGGRLATARNNGARESIFDTLFFIDADTYPTNKYFLSEALKEFNERGLDVAGTLLSPDFSGNKLKSLLYKSFFDIESYFLLRKQNSSKPKMQSGMFFKRDVFFTFNGFKEGIFGEDSEFAERAVKHNPPFKFGILRDCGTLKSSVRRYEREGFLKTLSKVIYLNAKAEIFGYDSLKGVYDKFYELK